MYFLNQDNWKALQSFVVLPYSKVTQIRLDGNLDMSEWYNNMTEW